MLDAERKFLSSHREELLKQYGGKILVIKGEEVSGAYDTMNEALQAAALTHGLDNVLIRKPADADPDVSVPALTLGILSAGISQPDRSAGQDS